MSGADLLAEWHAHLVHARRRSPHTVRADGAAAARLVAALACEQWPQLARIDAATLRHKKPENWLDAVARRGDGLQAETALDRPEQAAEALLMGLRLAEGIDLGAIAARFGYAPDALIVPEKVAFYARLGLIERTGDRLTVTPPGMPLLDALLAELVAPALVAA